MLFTTNEGAVDYVPCPQLNDTPACKVDGMAYFPLFAGKDAKFAKIQALPFVKRLVDGEIT